MKAGRKPGAPKTGGRDFKPGQSGNPNGRPKLPDDIRAIQALSPAYVRNLIAKFARMSKDEMQIFMQSSAPTMIDLMIGSIVTKAIQEGDYSRLNFLLDRSIGKVKEEIDLTVTPRFVYKTTMTEDGRLLQDLLKEELTDGQ